MGTFTDKERLCEMAFDEIGECYHLWTPENFEIIFSRADDFKVGMCVIGICAKLSPDVRILTFEIMSNHLHIAAAGRLNLIMSLFALVKETLDRCFKSAGRIIGWNGFIANHRLLNNLSDVRNVIVYDNRNGYVVSSNHTPFTYPWGANRYYFNPDACRLAKENSKVMTLRKVRAMSHSRVADGIRDLLEFDGYALPLSFCDIETGERLFRDPAHYFSKISRNIEPNTAIAKEIGESVYYTDDDLFDAISRISRQKYNEPLPSRLNAQNKIEVAKTMRYEYNASPKQIQRMLKLDPGIVAALFQKLGL